MMTIKHMKKHFDKFRGLNGKIKWTQPFSPSSTPDHNIAFIQPSPLLPPPPTSQCLLIMPTVYCQCRVKERQGTTVTGRWKQAKTSEIDERGLAGELAGSLYSWYWLKSTVWNEYKIVYQLYFNFFKPKKLKLK